MTTNTVPTDLTEPRLVTIPVTVECPTWCTADHSGALGLDDVWHTRMLATVDEDTDVRLALSEVSRLMLGYDVPPEININMAGNAVEFQIGGARRDNTLEVDQFRDLATMVARAAEVLTTVPGVQS